MCRSEPALVEEENSRRATVTNSFKLRALAAREYGFVMPAKSTLYDLGVSNTISLRQRCAQ